MQAEPPQGPMFEVRVPGELENGVYSDVISVWSTPFEFTLDFGVLLPSIQPQGAEPRRVPCNVVSRVKIPPSVIFSLMRALSEQMDKYEKAYGKITEPSPPAEGEGEV